MIRLDKACDLSPFTDKTSSRYSLAAIRFRPPNPDEVAKHYRELRKPREGKRTVEKNRQSLDGNHPTTTATRKYRHREYAGMVTMNASLAYAQAVAKVRATMEATDGRMLISVPCLNGDEFPATPGAGKEPKECLIHGDHIKAAVRRIPKNKTKPVLESIRLTRTDDDRVILSTTDIERATDETVRQVDGRFPNTDSIWPTATPEITVRLDPALLEQIVKHAKAHSADGYMEVMLRDSESAVEFRYPLSDDREAKALLMPAAGDKKRA